MTHWGNKMNDLMTIYQKILGIRLNTIDFGSVNMGAQNKWYQTGKISSFFCWFFSFAKNFIDCPMGSYKGWKWY